MIDFGATPQKAETKALTVSELTRSIKGLIEKGFVSIWVSGEVSNLSRPTSGHLYFSLKDSKAVIRACFFRGFALRAKFDLKDGMEILARGSVTVYEPRGDYQFIIEEVQQKGVGAQELALRELKQKLFVKGYFDPKRKRRLPRFPRRVALVCSPTGAAVRDLLEVLRRRWPRAEVWVCGVRVQGEGAAGEIAGAIHRLNQVRPTADVLILGRGGGSTEDLWAFNEEVVADAIFASRIVVVSAVGHEVDLTIADQVADKRALTPSEAAELVVPDRRELLDQLLGTYTQLRNLLLARVKKERERLIDLTRRRVFRLPLERVHELAQQVDVWEERLHRAQRRQLGLAHQQVEALRVRLEAARPQQRLRRLHERLDNLGVRLHRAGKQTTQRVNERLSAMAARLEGISPLNVLARGYSLTRMTATGQVVRRPNQLEVGDRIETALQEGWIVSRVEEVGVDHD